MRVEGLTTTSPQMTKSLPWQVCIETCFKTKREVFTLSNFPAKHFPTIHFSLWFIFPQSFNHNYVVFLAVHFSNVTFSHNYFPLSFIMSEFHSLNCFRLHYCQPIVHKDNFLFFRRNYKRSFLLTLNDRIFDTLNQRKHNSSADGRSAG